MNAEYVGECQQCHNHVYCREGFLDGVVTDDKRLFCRSCWATIEKSLQSKEDRRHDGHL